jgi:hypothetical protein
LTLLGKALIRPPCRPRTRLFAALLQRASRPAGARPLLCPHRQRNRPAASGEGKS